MANFVVYYAYTYTNIYIYIYIYICQHIYIYIYIYMLTSMNERTRFFTKRSLSHIILDVSVVCERWVETGTTAILTQVHLLTIAALLLHLGLGCSTGDHRGPQPTVCKLVLTLIFLSPTNSSAAGTCLYSFITPTCFRFFFCLFTQVHLWRLGQGSIYNNWISKPLLLSLILTGHSIRQALCHNWANPDK